MQQKVDFNVMNCAEHMSDARYKVGHQLSMYQVCAYDCQHEATLQGCAACQYSNSSSTACGDDAQSRHLQSKFSACKLLS